MQFLIDIALSLIYFLLFLLLCAWTWRFWVMYINQKHLNGIEWIMLEIKLPREIFKSPYATEVAIACLLQGGGVGTWYHRLIKGNLPAFASLEIASIEGIVHFYVRAQKKFRNLIESNFYAQYPGIEIVEAQDYTSLIRFDHRSKDVSLFGMSYKLGAKWKLWDAKTGDRVKKGGDDYEMPADFFPLKTYVDYELDKNPKEEFKIDPIAPLIEFMGSIGKGEHFWYQIILQDESVYNNKKFPFFYVNEISHEHVSLKKMADTYKQELRIPGFNPKGTVVSKKFSGKFDNDGNPVMDNIVNEDPTPKDKKETDLTQEDKADIENINKKFSKPLAMGTIRLMYIADNNKTKFNGGQIQNIVSFMKPFSAGGARGKNWLVPNTVSDPYDYPWENFMNRRVPWRAEEFFEAYVEREAFFPHIPSGRKSLDRMEDSFFFSSSMKTRKTWRMLYEAIFYPFNHPHPGEVSTYNLEEIATLWHLPGSVITTPTLPRIDSAKAVAPVNLPQ